MRTGAQLIVYLSLICIMGITVGCAVQQKPVVHTVGYQSDVACALESKDCPWAHLEEQAKFSSLVNCLLSGANVLQDETSGQDDEGKVLTVAPKSPKYGYEFRIRPGDGEQCASQQFACSVASRIDNDVTRAGCETEALEEEVLMGGRDRQHADLLTKSTVVAGRLAASIGTFQHPEGLNGPDQYYTFNLTKKTAVEIAVAVNSSQWSPTKGHRTPWQPGLSLLTVDGRKIGDGHLWRAGVTYLLPTELDPGRYYLVVDSAQREFSRGDGRYRLYLGLNRTHMGSIRSQ
ncbi:MAG: hypothetical protein ACPGYT_01965 [Nitrospirales bacterium]